MNDTKVPSVDRDATAKTSDANVEAELERQAKEYLEGIVRKPEEVLAIANQLSDFKSFTYARRILKRASSDPSLNSNKAFKLKFFQKLALYTYKDDDLPIDLRLNDANSILREVEDIDTTTDQETLGLMGSIYKRLWEVDNQKIQLERAQLFYRRGYEQGVEKDGGYTGINSAFVLDWLAFQEESEERTANRKSRVARGRRRVARKIRREIIAKVRRPEAKEKWWWYYSTLAEANLGLDEYHEMARLLLEAREELGTIPEWQEESTLQQFVRLAMFQSDAGLSGRDFEKTAAWSALVQVFGNRISAVRSAFIGKIGLALSGGGFRASLFHIGTLARLAELDVLRHVEVISCVSGGSIVGAHYYLKVRELLQSKYDADAAARQKGGVKPEEIITKQGYIKIVEEMVDEFLAGVKTNIRVSVASRPITNLRMLLPKYSRTVRAGELYEERLFSPILAKTKSANGDQLLLKNLIIKPKGEVELFNPRLHNWRRSEKVPILVLNAATLNTGHNWQFTMSWMGEPPSSIRTGIDTNDQLRRMYHGEAPVAHRKIRLGAAVTASACVPGLFEPLFLDGLYDDRKVGLVDGGVCDNQGVSSLLEQGCTVILVSDGSGQMTSLEQSPKSLIGVPLRSNSILQARIRDAQYHDLERRKRSSLLRGLMFIHLKSDLVVKHVDWVKCRDPYERTTVTKPLTRYGIDREIQGQLAGIRTDLDSFSDVEAYALMTSAYRMTDDAFGNQACVDGFSDQGVRRPWKFLQVESAMKGEGPEYEHLKSLLGVSGNLAFKVWRQSRVLRAMGAVAGVVVLAAILWLAVAFSSYVLVKQIPAIALGIEVVLVIALLVGILLSATVFRIAFAIGMGTIGWAVAFAHLKFFDKIFLKSGSIERFNAVKNGNK